ncbi:hypothetical protein MX031_24020, partial [Ralstonia solanacearum]|uniref:hypothetical protein n=1 Tax=Ralstonia solanacearum TaxID=305 RepID=UPI00202A1FEF
MSFGTHAIYAIEMTMPDGKEVVTPIYPNDYQIVKFSKFRITRESLASPDALEDLLNNEIKNGNLSATKVTVHSVEKWRSTAYKYLYTKQTIRAKPISAVQYHFLGRLGTILSTRRTIIQNKKQEKSIKMRTTTARESLINEVVNGIASHPT